MPKEHGCKTCSFAFSQVEMAGIEPASERLDPQISTSVAGCLCRQVSHIRQRISPGQPLEPEDSSFARLAVFRAALRLCYAQPTSGRRAGQVDVALSRRASATRLAYAARGRAARFVRLALCCALISRGRRLSTRNLGSASSVEACHPQAPHYTAHHISCEGCRVILRCNFSRPVVFLS